MMAVLDKSMALPSREDMEADIERDQLWRRELGWAPHYAHLLLKHQWSYNDSLAKLVGFEPGQPVLKKLYDHVFLRRSTAVADYKKEYLRVTGPESFCVE